MNAIKEFKERYDLKELAENYIEQNHFGDFLIFESDEVRLWNNHKNNQQQGEPKFELELLIDGGWVTVDKEY